MTALLAVVFAACTATNDASDQSADPKTITAEELAGQIQDSRAPLILDVRSPTEYARGHIPGSLNIPYDELNSRLSEIDVPKTEEIVVHCQGGRRAQIAENILHAAGYSNVRDLDGHMAGWQKNGYPVEQP